MTERNTTTIQPEGLPEQARLTISATNPVTIAGTFRSDADESRALGWIHYWTCSPGGEPDSGTLESVAELLPGMISEGILAFVDGAWRCSRVQQVTVVSNDHAQAITELQRSGKAKIAGPTKYEQGDVHVSYRPVELPEDAEVVFAVTRLSHGLPGFSAGEGKARDRKLAMPVALLLQEELRDVAYAFPEPEDFAAAMVVKFAELAEAGRVTYTNGAWALAA